MYQDAFSSRITRWLIRLFPSKFLEEQGEELGLVEREGKFQIPVPHVGARVRLRRLHLLYSATDKTIERKDMADEKTHYSTLFNTGSWLQWRLVLHNLAYFKYRRFAETWCVLSFRRSSFIFWSRLKTV